MSKLTAWIKRHQIAAFFIITFAITWGLGFSYAGFLKQGQFLLVPLVTIATCGPALAGIMISAVSNTRPKQGTRKAFWIAFFVAWGVSALVFLAHNTFFNITPFSLAVVVFSLVAVVPVAFVIGSAYSRIPTVKDYLSSLVRLRGVWGWSFLGLVLMPVLILISVPVSNILGREPTSVHQFPDTGLVLIGLVAVKFLYQLFFFNATGEETGWRGFALPRLQARTSPLVAALVLAFFWVPWHFFLWQAERNPVLTLQYWIDMYIVTVPLSLLIVWIYNRSKGSILVAGITHAASNTAVAFIPHPDLQGLSLTLSVAALVMILVDRTWKKLPPDHPAVYRSPQQLAAPDAAPPQ
jgi:membrane protease YdiL (CAAX protease family)